MGCPRACCRRRAGAQDPGGDGGRPCPGRYCSPRHPSHFKPSSLELNGNLRLTLDRGVARPVRREGHQLHRRAVRQCLADSACPVTLVGCRFSQEKRVQYALHDVASNIFRALPNGSKYHADEGDPLHNADLYLVGHNSSNVHRAPGRSHSQCEHQPAPSAISRGQKQTVNVASVMHLPLPPGLLRPGAALRARAQKGVRLRARFGGAS